MDSQYNIADGTYLNLTIKQDEISILNEISISQYILGYMLFKQNELINIIFCEYKLGYDVELFMM